MSCNFLTLNASKCKYMLVSRSRIHQYPQLYLADQPLECVQSYKYLGVTITSLYPGQTISSWSATKAGDLWAYSIINSTPIHWHTLSILPACLVFGHILNTHVQFGIPTLQKKDLFWRMCKSLPARFAVQTDTWTMRACWHTWTSHCYNRGGCN